MNIIYTVSDYQHIDKEYGLRWLQNRKARHCIDRLKRAIKVLGIEQSRDYWAATAGNAGYALSILLKWAQENRNCVFEID